LEPSDKDEPASLGGAVEAAVLVDADVGVDADAAADAERNLAASASGGLDAELGGEDAGGHADADAFLEGRGFGGEGEPRDHGTCTMVSETLARIGDKWTVLVVELLCAGRGPVRFNEIRRAIEGISQRMLTLTLRGLERDGLVTRTVHPTIPPRVDYELTKLGQSLRVPLVAVAEWARANRAGIVEARKVFDATSTASPSSRQVRRRAPALLSRARLARPRQV
jgi:DNA-binding HxlR family transcriptional regulator